MSVVWNAKTEPTQMHLPLWKRAVFFDWHGVLCSTRFWSSIVDTTHHTFQGRLGTAVQSVFSNNNLTQRWMRGQIADSDVVQILPVESKRWSKSFLLRRLVDDCSTMPVNSDFIRLIGMVRTAAYCGLATDNMNCFAEAAARRADLASFFDVVICSSIIGTLKADDAEKFFGDPLRRIGLTIRDAVLIDDSEENCEAFVRAGGLAIVHTSFSNTETRLRALMFDPVSYLPPVK